MERYKYDVFISHAVEDKIEIANELCKRLERAGLKVWYSGNELSIGDRIESMIQKGLEQSRFGIAVLTKHYIKKNWTMREFYSMLAKERDDRKVILPVLHDISISDLRAKDLTIADKFGISTANGLDHVVNRIKNVISKEKAQENELKVSGISMASFSQQKVNKQSTLMAVLFTLLISISGFAIYSKFNHDVPTDALVYSEIGDRVNTLINHIDKKQREVINAQSGYYGTTEEIDRLLSQYMANRTPFKNVYKFDNGFETLGKRKQIEPIIKINLSSIYPNQYGIKKPKIIIKNKRESGAMVEVGYALVNDEVPGYQVESRKLKNDYEYLVEVHYENPIQYVSVDMAYSDAEMTEKKASVQLEGFKALETFVFGKGQQGWELDRVE